MHCLNFHSKKSKTIHAEVSFRGKLIYSKRAVKKHMDAVYATEEEIFIYLNYKRAQRANQANVKKYRNSIKKEGVFPYNNIL